MTDAGKIHEIELHISKKQKEKYRLTVLLDDILFLDGLKDETISEIKAVISGKIAQCDISIRDHKKLLPTNQIK